MILRCDTSKFRTYSTFNWNFNPGDRVWVKDLFIMEEALLLATVVGYQIVDLGVPPPRKYKSDAEWRCYHVTKACILTPAAAAKAYTLAAALESSTSAKSSS